VVGSGWGSWRVLRRNRPLVGEGRDDGRAMVGHVEAAVEDVRLALSGKRYRSRRVGGAWGRPEVPGTGNAVRVHDRVPAPKKLSTPSARSASRNLTSHHDEVNWDTSGTGNATVPSWKKVYAEHQGEE
jgi:hypothetical protein